MSNKFIKKTINITLLVLFILFSGISAFKFYSIYKDSISLDEAIDKDDAVNPEEEELNVPIDESELSNKDESVPSENFDNTGARYDKDEPAYKLEIINLESLSKVIPTNGNQLSEVYYSTLSQVRKIINGDTYYYIDESTMSYKNSTLTFTLFDYSNDKKISDISVKLLNTGTDKKTETITEFKIQNLEVLKEYIPKAPDYLIHAYQTITDEVMKDSPKAKGCFIDKESISKEKNSVSFDVLDLTNKSKLKKITLEY